MNFYEKLKEYFTKTPREKVLDDWEKSKEFDRIEVTVEEFLKPKAYLVLYKKREWSEACPSPLFITLNQEVAINYVNKFNRILKAWREHIKKYEHKEDFQDNYLDYVNRYYNIKELGYSYYLEIELR